MKNQLKLFEPFFNEELDFKNDYVSYIYTTLNKATSVIHNNIKNLLINKFGVKPEFKKMTTKAKLQSIKLSEISILACGIIWDSIASNSPYLNNRNHTMACQA